MLRKERRTLLALFLSAHALPLAGQSPDELASRLVRQMASELGRHNITVNSVAPGFMPTSPDYVRQWQSYTPERQARSSPRSS